MAYVEEYFAQWHNNSGVLKEIKLLKEGGSGTTEIILLQPVPFRENKRGGKEVQLENVIQGREVQFNFISNTTDIAGFDAMFKSEYKEWKVEYYSNSVLDGVFWLQPENRSRNWIENGDYYEISLSATDGLANLKSIEFIDESTGDQFTDRVSIIATVKRALEHVGHELDFWVQLGTWCTNVGGSMTATDCALDKGDADNTRYTKTKDGREVNEDCYTIIEKVLKDFNVYLVQRGAKYWIVNPQEIDSYYFPIAWSDLSIDPRVANDLSVDLAGYDYLGLGELQNIRPLETVEVTFKDRNVQDNLLSNGDFSGGATTGWNKTGYFAPFSAANFYLRQPVVFALDGDPTYIYTDDETITARGSDDLVSVTFKVRIQGYVGDPGNEPMFTVKLFKGAVEIAAIGFNTVGLYESTEFTEYTVQFPLATTGSDYSVRFQSFPRTTGDYVSFNLDLDDVIVVPIYGDGADITFDRFYKVNNTDDDYKDVDEQDLFFGDSVQDNDIGSYQIGGTRTQTWNRFGKTENDSIQELFGQNIIENYSQYKNYLRVNIIDPDENINITSILIEDAINYQIVSIETNHGTGLRAEITCELIEVLNSSVTTAITNQSLTSIDGDSSPSTTTTIIQGGTTSDHGLLTNLQADHHNTVYFNQIRGDARYALIGGYWDIVTGGIRYNDLVGMGTIPSYPLHVFRNTDSVLLARFEGAGNESVDIYDFGVTINRSSAFISNAATGGVLLFRTTSSGSGIQVRLRIVGSGNQTIIYKTDGVELIQFNTDSSDPRILFHDSAGANSTSIYEDVTNKGGTRGSLLIDAGGEDDYEGLNIGGRLAFVHDNATFGGIWDDVNQQWCLRTDNGSFTIMYYDGSQKARTAADGLVIFGALRATGEVESFDTSDERLKENIKNLDPVKVTADLMKLRCIEYDHKKKKKHEIGLIAQEVIKYFPENVKENDEKELMIQYSKMIPLLLSTIQHQEERLLRLEISIFDKVINWFKKWL